MQKRRRTLLTVLGAIVRRRRRQLTLSEETVAQKIGVSVSTVKQIEHGAFNITVLHLQPLAKVLRLTLPELLGRAEKYFGAVRNSAAKRSQRSHLFRTTSHRVTRASKAKGTRN